MLIRTSFYVETTEVYWFNYNKLQEIFFKLELYGFFTWIVWTHMICFCDCFAVCPVAVKLCLYVSHRAFLGVMKVMHLDSDYAMMYECYSEKVDGTCEADDTSFEILARNSSMRDKRRLDYMVGLARTACVNSEDLVDVSHSSKY